MSIDEAIHAKMKIGFIKWGDARVFGEESDVRRKLTDEECLEWFSRVWAEKLVGEVAEAPEITREEAKELLDSRYHPFVIPGQSYRQFSLYRVPFVARLTPAGVCDQLWALGTHRDNTRLCMYFDTIREKGRFDSIAKKLGWEPRELALRLVTDFVEKVER